jgi:hypothetical protein
LLFQPRQFPRLSLSIDVKVRCSSEVLVLRSQEIGAGGMALENASKLSVAQPVHLSFILPEGPELKLDAVVWWKRDHRVGIRFDMRDGAWRQVEQWVQQQLKLV